MSSITQKIFIKASPDEVFDLIAGVEDFSKYSSYIKEIKKVADRKYRWRVELLGFTFEWEADVSEYRRPERFAWRSSEGVFNAGSYELRPSLGGTEVVFRMEFRLTGSPIEAVIAPVLGPLISIVAGELLGEIKKRLEGKRQSP